MGSLIVPGAILAVALIWAVAHYNRFVRLAAHIKESWSDIDVELKRRYELIPNLVATVKGYAAHEREVLERVLELRRTAMASNGPAERQAVDEDALLLGLRRLFVVAESYPELKANEGYLALQRELALTEDRVAAARRFFNSNVRDMRQLCQMFPSSILARVFGFEAGGYFQLSSEAERVVPPIQIEGRED